MATRSVRNLPQHTEFNLTFITDLQDHSRMPLGTSKKITVAAEYHNVTKSSKFSFTMIQPHDKNALKGHEDKCIHLLLSVKIDSVAFSGHLNI